MSARAELAAAASSVAGVDVSETWRQVTDPGAGMVRLDRVEYPDRFGGLEWWQVLVLLPHDLADAERQLEAWTPALVSALADVLTVRSVRPQTMAVDATRQGGLPCIVVEGFRETE